jgi:sec-independent protein translocase protein TatB
VFNLQGSELIIILLLALVVLGPEKLPDAMRKLGNFYAQMKKMSTSFQQEFKAAVDEPMREVRETANMLRDSADFRKLSAGERTEKPKSAEMAGTTAALAAAAETASTETASTETAASDTAASDVVRPGTAPSSEPADAADPTPTATSTPLRDPFGGVSSASPRPTGRNGTAAGGPVDIPSPKPPAGPVVTGTPPLPGAAAPPPPPPPPPPANGAASPGGDALPPLAPSEVEAE